MVEQSNENDSDSNGDCNTEHKRKKGDKLMVNQPNKNDSNGNGDCNAKQKRKKGDKPIVSKSNENYGNGSSNGGNWNKRQDSSTGTDESARLLSCDNTDDTEELSKTLRKNKTNNVMSIADVTIATSTTNNGDTWESAAAPAVEFPLTQHKEQYEYSSASSHPSQQVQWDDSTREKIQMIRLTTRKNLLLHV